MLLLGAAVPQQRAHDVHLRMRRARIAAAALISSRMTAAARSGSPEPPYSSGISAREEARLGQRLDESVG